MGLIVGFRRMGGVSSASRFARALENRLRIEGFVRGVWSSTGLEVLRVTVVCFEVPRANERPALGFSAGVAGDVRASASVPARVVVRSRGRNDLLACSFGSSVDAGEDSFWGEIRVFLPNKKAGAAGFTGAGIANVVAIIESGSR